MSPKGAFITGADFLIDGGATTSYFYDTLKQEKIVGGDFMTIAEAAKKYDLTPNTLRYYERIGLIPGVRRTSGGIRDYHEEDYR